MNEFALPTLLQHSTIGQIGIVVDDLDRALGHYGDLLAIDTWNIYTYSPDTVPVLSFRGQPGKFSMRLALGGSGPQIELIEPLSGPSLYHEWLDRNGSGVQHLGIFVPSLDAALTGMRSAGHEPSQHGAGYGLDGDGGFAYFETGADLGFILELIEVPRRRRTPERIWRTNTGQQSTD